MNALRRLRCLVGLVFALGLAAQAGEAAVKSRPGYRRDDTPRPPTSRRSAPTLPEALVVPVASTPQAVRSGPGRGAPAAAAEAAQARGVRARAEQEAVRAAGRARRQYYLAGYRDGLRAAVADESLGRWDHLQGLVLGRLDPEALRAGRVEGREAALAAAGAAARERVEAQFRDLSRDPDFAPGSLRPAFEPPTQWTDEVVLEEIWRLIPVAPDARGAARFSEARAGTAYVPRDLYGLPGTDAVVDRSWVEPRYERSAARTRPQATGADATARVDLREEFDRAYRARIAAEFRRTVRPAYEVGFADGWDHGARIRYEWSFRLGYARGFDEAASAACRSAYLDTFPRAYRSAYARVYDEWRANPHLEIVTVDWTDGNGDGVLQPGESLVVDYEVANYGGADAVVEVALDSGRLRTGRPATVTVPPRAMVRSPWQLRASVSPSTPARTRAAVAVRVGDLRAGLELEVRWPLELTGVVRLAEVRVLEGAARLEIEMLNRGNRPLEAAVRLDGSVADRVVALRQPGTIPAGRRARAWIDLEGLRPLDLLAGRLETGLLAYAGEEQQDVRAYRFPELAVDLERTDLLDYLVSLARDAGAAHSEVAEARRLLGRRLRADWDRAVRSRGNPYKSDLRRGTSETALGELVRLRERQASAVRRGDVFAGLDEEVEALARELPGVHPFLRKSMRRLARRLG